MKYEEFQLLATQVQAVTSEGKRLVKFQIQVPGSPVGEIVSGVPAEYNADEMRELLSEWDDRELDWPEVMRVGVWLSNTIFPPRVRELLGRSLDLVKQRGNRLRLRLMLEGRLHNLPWEYVLLNRAGGEATINDFLALSPDVAVVRHQAATMPAWPVKAALPAQMLVALSSPEGWRALSLSGERKAVSDALKDNKHIEVTWKEHATAKGLWSGVNRAHLFHFAGHGDFKAEMGRQPGTTEGEGLLILEDEGGNPQELNATGLALQLREKGVRVAVLGACRSGRRDDVNVWTSTAAALLKAELGAVVGMQYKVHDKSAIAFAGEFYKRLAVGQTIEEAVTAGRIRVTQDDVRDWATPVLYLRVGDSVIFPEYAADPGLEATRKQLRVEAEQDIQTLRGKATVIKVGSINQGELKGKQKIGTVEKGAEATVVEIGNLGGGSVEAHQEVDDVKGSITGVSINNLGSKSNSK